MEEGLVWWERMVECSNGVRQRGKERGHGRRVA